jgi:hypothetical protein
MGGQFTTPATDGGGWLTVSYAKPTKREPNGLEDTTARHDGTRPQAS